MRLVRSKDERVARDNFGLSIFIAHAAFAAHDQIHFPLRRMGVEREIRLARRHTAPFQIEWLPFLSVARDSVARSPRTTATERFRNSLERDREFALRRLPRLFL